MRITNVAKNEEAFIEKAVSLEKLPNGNFELVAKSLPVGGQVQQEMHMEFTKQGYQALMSSWLIFDQADKCHAEV